MPFRRNPEPSATSEMLPQATGAAGAGTQPGAQAQQAHLAYMQQFQQAQLRQQVAYMQQAMSYPGFAPPYPMPGYPGASPYMGGMPMQGLGGGGKGKGKFGKGGFGGKGKGKGGGKGKSKGDDEDGEKAEGEDGERAPRVRKDEPPIVKAQREAREKAEAVILKQLQGRWVDAADADITYTVEGNTCSVANKNGGRTFHNRLSMYGVEFCWNAKRFWHDVNLKALQSSGDEPEKVEWNPGKNSPPAEQIIWLRAPPEPEKPEGEEAAEAAPADSGEAKAEAPAEAPADA